ncbi:MAG: hypothetical protein F6K26_34335 [Moorea sp. SIO2I5]|nr:hypothetical protein [Moorena sp. SIO2I5]
MKGKILNYFVIIGVSIILLLGIFTTAFAKANDFWCHPVTLTCYARLHYRKSDDNKIPILGYIKEGIKVTKIEDPYLNSYVKIKLDSYDFLIRKRFLDDECLDRSDPNTCRIIVKK